MLKALMCFAVAFGLSACGGSDEASENKSSTLAQYAASAEGSAPTPQRSAGTAGQPRAQQAPVEQSAQPAPVPPPQNKIYTYQGNVLLPPNAYMDNPRNKVENVNVCGVLSPTQNNGQQQYCYKFSEISNRLYDADHSGLDVWDVQGDWYLLLTKPSGGSGGAFGGGKADSGATPRELWVQRSKFGVYHPYADVMEQKLLFLGDWDYKVEPEWPLQAYDAPGGSVIELKKENYPNMKSKNPMVAITEVAQSSQKELWFKLNLINSLCETRRGGDQGVDAPVITNVWYPAYRLDGHLRIPTVWFSAKGC